MLAAQSRARVRVRRVRGQWKWCRQAGRTQSQLDAHVCMMSASCSFAHDDRSLFVPVRTVRTVVRPCTHANTLYSFVPLSRHGLNRVTKHLNPPSWSTAAEGG